GGPVAGADIDLCPIPTGPCLTTTSGLDGGYSFPRFPAGDYRVTVEPGLTAPVADLVPQTIPDESFGVGIDLSEDFTLERVTPLPAGATVGGAGVRSVSAGLPVVYWLRIRTLT